MEGLSRRDGIGAADMWWSLNGRKFIFKVTGGQLFDSTIYGGYLQGESKYTPGISSSPTRTTSDNSL